VNGSAKDSKQLRKHFASPEVLRKLKQTKINVKVDVSPKLKPLGEKENQALQEVKILPMKEEQKVEIVSVDEQQINTAINEDNYNASSSDLMSDDSNDSLQVAGLLDTPQENNMLA